MRNIIKINVDNSGYYTLSNIDDGTNTICVQFTKSGVCEIYYGDQYYEEMPIPESGLIEIPAAYYSDESNMRFRYESNNYVSGFIHIVGDASKYTDLILLKATDSIIQISGNSDSTDDYSDIKIPPATRIRLGGVKVGSGLNINKDGTLSLDFDTIKEVVGNNGSSEIVGEVMSTATDISLYFDEVYEGVTT